MREELKLIGLIVATIILSSIPSYLNHLYYKSFENKVEWEYVDVEYGEGLNSVLIKSNDELTETELTALKKLVVKSEENNHHRDQYDQFLLKFDRYLYTPILKKEE